MKVTLNPDGSVSFDVADPVQAAVLGRALMNGKSSVVVVKDGPAEQLGLDVTPMMNGKAAKSRKSKKRSPAVVDKATAAKAQEMGLTVLQYLTWEFLADRKSGAGPKQVMSRFRISTEAASQRLSTLVRAGYATRSTRGHYLAVLPMREETHQPA